MEVQHSQMNPSLQGLGDRPRSNTWLFWSQRLFCAWLILPGAIERGPEGGGLYFMGFNIPDKLSKAYKSIWSNYVFLGYFLNHTGRPLTVQTCTDCTYFILLPHSVYTVRSRIIGTLDEYKQKRQKTNNTITQIYCNFPTCEKYFTLLMIQWNQPKLHLYSALYNWCFSFTHRRRLAVMPGTNQLVRSNRGHFTTPREGSNCQPSDWPTTAPISWAYVAPS